MKEVICLLVILCITRVLMTPILTINHNMPQQKPFFKNAFAMNKFQGLQNALKNKETSNMCNQQVKFPLQSKLNASLDDTMTNFQVRPLQSMISRIDTILEKSPYIREKLKKKLPSTIRMTLEEKKLISQNSNMPQYSSNRSDECPFVCPKAESFFPCTCNPCDKSINCSAISNFMELYELFHNVYFPLTAFKKFLLSHAPQRFSPNQTIFFDNMFGPVSFKEIHVENTAIEEVKNQAFKGSEDTLEIINFEWNSNLHIFPFTQLGNFQNLKMLQLTGGSLDKIPVLSRIPNLSVIFLHQNKITEIPSMAFANLHELVVLDMASNKLEKIQENQLNFAAPDVAIYLDHNNIDFIHDRAFSNYQPGLLDVSKNNLNTLNENVFQPILDLIINNNYESYVNADKNPLCCNSILWVLSNPLYLLYMLLPDPNCSWY